MIIPFTKPYVIGYCVAATITVAVPVVYYNTGSTKEASADVPPSSSKIHPNTPCSSGGGLAKKQNFQRTESESPTCVIDLQRFSGELKDDDDEQQQQIELKEFSDSFAELESLIIKKEVITKFKEIQLTTELLNQLNKATIDVKEIRKLVKEGANLQNIEIIKRTITLLNNNTKANMIIVRLLIANGCGYGSGDDDIKFNNLKAALHAKNLHIEKLYCIFHQEEPLQDDANTYKQLLEEKKDCRWTHCPMCKGIKDTSDERYIAKSTANLYTQQQQ